MAGGGLRVRAGRTVVRRASGAVGLAAGFLHSGSWRHTERKRAEEALRKVHDELGIRVQERTAELARANEELQQEMERRGKAEQQLRQAQKMDAIGALTGSIAHDLNNIFPPIVINSQLILLNPPGDSGIRGQLELILKSGLWDRPAEDLPSGGLSRSEYHPRGC